MSDNTETFTTTHQVPEHNLPKLRDGIDKINKRCRRLGVQEITLQETGEEFRQVEIKVDEVEDEHGCRDVYMPRTIRFVTVVVTGQAPRINGWTFAATITDLEGINMLSTVPGLDRGIPEVYRTAPSKCDHCGYARNRKETFVLFSDDRWVQVGRQCLKDFLGYNNPHKVADYCSLLGSLAELCDECDDYARSGGGSMEVWTQLFSEAGAPQYSYLSVVALCIRLYGWMSKGKAREQDKIDLATANVAMDLIYPGMSEESKSQARKVLAKMTPADQELAQKALEWAQALPVEGIDDYLHNVRTLAVKGMTNYRFSGIAASIVPAYARAHDIELQRKKEQESNYFGTEGKREVFTLTLQKTIAINSEINGFLRTSYLHKFVDANGNVAIWFASNPSIVPVKLNETFVSTEWMKEEETYTVKATVKRHEERKGVKQTILSRVAIDVPKPPKARKAKKTAEPPVENPDGSTFQDEGTQ